jgi:hypothetical protein
MMAAFSAASLFPQKSQFFRPSLCKTFHNLGYVKQMIMQSDTLLFL